MHSIGVSIFLYTTVLHSLFHLARKDIYADRSRVFIGVLALTITIAFSILLAALVGSFLRITEEKVTGGASPNTIRVLPQFSVGFFKVTKQEQKQIDSGALTAFRNIPGVEQVRGEMVLEFPASLDVSVFGTRFETDSPIYGIDDAVFAELSGNAQVEEDIYPVLVSQELVDIYNLGIARAINQPMINEEILNGFELDIVLGYSSFFREQTSSKEKKTLKGKVVAVSDNIPIIGITLPTSVVEKLNQEYVGDEYTPRYTRAYIEKNTTASYDNIEQEVVSLGYDAYSVMEEVRGVQGQLAFVVLFFYILVGVIVCLIMLLFYYLFHTHFRDRIYMFGLLRSLGASSRNIVVLFLTQIVLILLWGIVLGSAVALLVLALGNYTLTPLVASIITLKEPLLLLSWGEYGTVVSVISLCIIVSVLPPVWGALTLTSKEALSQ